MEDTPRHSDSKPLGRTFGFGSHEPVDTPEASAAAALDLLERPDWWQRAACLSGPNMFPTTTDGLERALQTCAGCPVTQPCHEAATRRGERHGVWGAQNFGPDIAWTTGDDLYVIVAGAGRPMRVPEIEEASGVNGTTILKWCRLMVAEGRMVDDTVDVFRPGKRFRSQTFEAVAA